MSNFTKIESNENGITWYEVNGTDTGTNETFENEIVGVTDDNVILDCDGSPSTEGDSHTVAVRNILDI